MKGCLSVLKFSPASTLWPLCDCYLIERTRFFFLSLFLSFPSTHTLFVSVFCVSPGGDQGPDAQHGT